MGEADLTNVLDNLTEETDLRLISEEAKIALAYGGLYAEENPYLDLKALRLNKSRNEHVHFDYHESQKPAYLNNQFPETIVKGKRWFFTFEILY